MKLNGVEEDLLNEVRKANPQDCLTIIRVLHALEGQEDEVGELTPLGELVLAINGELATNGIIKMA